MGTPTTAEEIPTGQLVPAGLTESDQESCGLVFDNEEAKGTVVLQRSGYGASLWVDGVEIAYVDLYYRAQEGKETQPDSLVRRNAVALCTHPGEDGMQGLLQYIRVEDGKIVSRTYDEVGLPIVSSRLRPIRDTDPVHVMQDDIPEAWEPTKSDDNAPAAG